MTRGRAGAGGGAMIEVPGAFLRMPRWCHDEPGRAWLAGLPEIVAGQCEQWGLDIDGAPWHGSNAIVVPTVRSGRPLALRLAPPGDDIAAEARALRLWDGRGTVLLYDVDLEQRATLLERLDGDATLASVPLPQAVDVVAEIALVLAVPVAADVPTTSGAAAELAASLVQDWEELEEPCSPSQLEAVLWAARARADAVVSDVAVDGDLHFRQVLRGRRAPWLVVDPLMMRGDLEYDLGRVLWSRLDEVESDDEVVALFDAFVGAVSVPRERAREWVLARAGSYLMWGLRRGLTSDPPRCQRLLRIFT